ncbi:hypothetical protein [Scytonema sp. PCC 10023]
MKNLYHLSTLEAVENGYLSSIICYTTFPFDASMIDTYGGLYEQQNIT